jgi:hypothetical protein
MASVVMTTSEEVEHGDPPEIACISPASAEECKRQMLARHGEAR